MENQKTITVQIINAFATDENGGNPAGVVLHADGLSNKDKLEIAKKVGVSETAFVSHSSSADYKLEFYTPTRQIAHCGHATIATFSYLRQLEKVNEGESSKETIDGNRRILLTDELAFMEQTAPTYLDVNHFQEQILHSLGLKKDQLVDNQPMKVVNTGNSFLIVPIQSTGDLKSIQPNFEQIKELSEALNLIGYYVFTANTRSKSIDATTRMFAPRYGIPEESGTGMAAGPLACYLYDILNKHQDRFLIQQGMFMNPPSISLITVDLTIVNAHIINLMAGGKGILKEQVIIELTD